MNERVELFQIQLKAQEAIIKILEYNQLNALFDEKKKIIHDLKTKIIEINTQNQISKEVIIMRRWHQGWIEKLFNQFLRLGRFILNLLTRYGIGETLNSITAPLGAAFSGIKALWDIVFAIRDKSIAERTTRILYGLWVLCGLGIALGLGLAGLVSLPTAFGVLTFWSMLAGAYKEGCIAEQIIKEIKNEKNKIAQDQNLLKIKTDEVPINSIDNKIREIEVSRLQEQITSRVKYLKNLENKLLDQQTKVAYYRIGALGAGLFTVGLVLGALAFLFPPLAVFSLYTLKTASAMILTSAIYYVEEKITNNAIARWLKDRFSKKPQKILEINNKQTNAREPIASSPKNLLNKLSGKPQPSNITLRSSIPKTAQKEKTLTYVMFNRKTRAFKNIDNNLSSVARLKL